MNSSKKIILTVTNDLVTDQRMHRICGSLNGAGYKVDLVGRRLKDSKELNLAYSYHRINSFFNTGFLFYAIYNFRLFIYLIGQRPDAICSIDLDTILAGKWASKLLGCKLIYDAHEYYTESPELDNRKVVKRFWEGIASRCIPSIDLGYTVNNSISQFLKARYKTDFSVIRNLPIYKNVEPNEEGKYLLYQGVLNKGRGLEELIRAMHEVESIDLKIAGNGDLSHELRELTRKEGLEDKVDFLGVLSPDELQLVTKRALIGFNLLDGTNKNYYYSLANKTFDYMMSGVACIAMNFPEYKEINIQHPFSILLDELDSKLIAKTINQLLSDPDKLESMKNASIKARKELNWKKEEEKLLSLYSSLFGNSLEV